MNEISQSNLLMWKESKGCFRFQTSDPKIARKMSGRRKFHLTAYALNDPCKIYSCDLPTTQAAISRYKGITGRLPRFDASEEIYY